jgi:hypothetical protein
VDPLLNTSGIIAAAGEAAAAATGTYYFANSGSDTTGDGSLSNPWATFAKADSMTLGPGAQLLFKGGDTFTALPAGANRVVDPGFESGSLNNWTENFDATSGNSTITSTPSAVHSGSYALQVGGSGAGGRGQVATSDFEPLLTYNLSVWADISNTSGAAYIGITFNDNGVQVASSSVTVSGSAYKQYSLTITAPAAFDYADVWCYKASGTSVLNVDDFSLTQASMGLALGAADSGNATSPVTISSYGTGPAIFSTGSMNAITATNTAYLNLSDLDLVGSGYASNNADGIGLYSTLTSGQVNNVHVDQVDIGGFGYNGVDATVSTAGDGYNNLQVTNATIHDCGYAGIQVQGVYDSSGSGSTYSNTNTYIGHDTVWNIYGRTNGEQHTGNGILLWDVNAATVERCVVHDTGINNTNASGPVGIWCFQADHVLFQFNESYHNLTGSSDGDGFDFDGGTINSTMQYNYAHGNAGAGFLVWEYTGARPMSGNTLRYNISENDGNTGTFYGGITTGGGTINTCDIYNNTVFQSPGGGPCVNLASLVNSLISNNILLTTGGAQLASTASGTFQGNDYWTSGGAFNIAGYTSLAAWQNATGQEKLNGNPVGYNVDPQLTAAGSGGTIGNADLLDTLASYKLLAISPLIDHGLNVASLLGTGNPGSQDFWGNSLPQGAGYDLGANEFAGFTTTVLSASPDPATLGQSVTLTAIVTSAGGMPAGSISFQDGTTLLGTATLNPSGVATLATAMFSPGSQSITAVYAGNSNFTASTSPPMNEMVVNSVTVTVTSVVINGNNALAGTQRSMVDSIVYTFSEAVTVAATGTDTNPGFAIAVHPGEQGTAPTLAWTAINPDASGASTQWVVTFTGSSVIGNSIANGVYDITLNIAAVTSEAHPTASITPRTTDTFYRLYGDYNGDQVVNAIDNLHFKSAITTYDPIFDYDNNGAVNAADNLHFKASISFSFNAPFTATI